MIYKVAITETSRKIVAVEAQSQAEAHRRVSDAWEAGEVYLDETDFDGLEVYVMGEANPDETLFKIDRKDV